MKDLNEILGNEVSEEIKNQVNEYVNTKTQSMYETGIHEGNKMNLSNLSKNLNLELSEENFNEFVEVAKPLLNKFKVDLKDTKNYKKKLSEVLNVIPDDIESLPNMMLTGDNKAAFEQLQEEVRKQTERANIAEAEKTKVLQETDIKFNTFVVEENYKKVLNNAFSDNKKKQLVHDTDVVFENIKQREKFKYINGEIVQANGTKYMVDNNPTSDPNVVLPYLAEKHKWVKFQSEGGGNIDPHLQGKINNIKSRDDLQIFLEQHNLGYKSNF